MKLASPQWTSVLEWDVCHPASLILENPQDYREIVGDISLQAEGEEGQLVFSREGNICSFMKEGLLIRDLWSVDVNQKKLLTGVCRQLVQIGQEEYYPQVTELLQECEELLEKLARDAMLSLEWESPTDLAPVLKAVGIRLESSEDPIDRLLDYVHLCQEFLHIRFVVLVGVRTMLTTQECSALCRDFAAAQLPVLFVDPFEKAMAEGERRLVIDADRCELILS